jgi:MFS transporter, ACDE family, multidrug resistance protein
LTETVIYRNRNFHIALGSSLVMMMLAVAIVPAFPGVVEAFKLSPQSVGLLITVNTLPTMLLAPLGGMLADRMGRKRLLVPSLIMFGIFGGACALAPDFNTLLILRLAQGLLSAPLQSITFAIISDLFKGRDRAEAMGINGTVMYSGYVIYPIVGGALAGLAWYYPFLVFLAAIPLGVAAIFILHYPEPRSEQSITSYVANTWIYLRSWKTAWLFCSNVLTYVLLFGAYLTYLGILITSRFNATPLALGVLVSVVGICTAAVSSQVGKLSRRFPPSALITVAFIGYAIALAMIPLMPGLWWCLAPAIIFGVSHGLNIPTTSLMASRIASPEHQAGFMAIQTTMILLGMTIAPLVMGLAYSFTDIGGAFFIAAAIALLVPVTAAIIGRRKLSV